MIVICFVLQTYCSDPHGIKVDRDDVILRVLWILGLYYFLSEFHLTGEGNEDNRSHDPWAIVACVIGLTTSDSGSRIELCEAREE